MQLFNNQTSLTMPRFPRQKSDTGVYHVMARGINRANIFLDDVDFAKMEKILRQATSCTDDEGHQIVPHCKIYAYCLMSNHIHILLQEQESVGLVMKRILVAYATYFNKRYNRIGTLFQGRFLSEPVNDEDYFLSLLDYIHLNPVKAHITTHPHEYKWSSYHNYQVDDAAAELCITSQTSPFSNMSRTELRTIVLNVNSAPKSHLDKQSITDYKAIEILETILPMHITLHEVKSLPLEQKRAIFAEAFNQGIKMRQLSRILNINVSVVSRLLASQNK